jgi:hypothetical protein
MPQRELVTCANGIFTLPEMVLASLRTASPNGFVYIRQDEDMFTISPARLSGGRRKHLNGQLRVSMFRDATRLMIIDLAEMYGIFAVEWRPSHRARVLADQA